MVRFARLRPAKKESTPESDEGWNVLYYSNAKDDRLWLPKRNGLGWTINFAHRLAWPAFLLLLTPIFIAIAVVAVVATHAR
jgi:uncharacterized membrane protein